MEIKIIVHQAEEGGYWAEIPAIPDCATSCETLKSYWGTYTKPWRAAFLPMFGTFRYRTRTGC